MADDVIDRMYVEILPQLDKFTADVKRDIDKLTRQMQNKFRDTAKVAEKEGNKAGKGFAEGFKTGGKAIAGGLAVGTAAIVGLGATAFKTFGDFDKTIRQFGAITGEAGAGLENMSDLALQMGKDTSFSAGQAADAMLELAKGGLTTAEIKAGALEATLTLAAAGGQSLSDAATTMANTLNTFGLGADSANAVAAALAGAANASTASVDSLGQALAQVGPGAKQAGLSMNETVAALAAFDSAGIKGSDAGTSLKTMLARLVPSTDKAKGTMEELGLVFTNTDGSFKSLSEIAQNLQDSLKNLSAEQRVAAINAIFGSDASRAAGVLADQGAKGIDNLTKATMDMGAAQKLAKTNTEGAAGSLEQLGGSVETALIVAGKAIAPFVTAVIKRLTGVVNWIITEMPKAFATIKDAIQPVIERVREAIESLGRIFENLRTFVEPLTPIFQALATVVGVVLYGAYLAVSTAIGAFISSIEPATQFLAEHRDVILGVVTVLGTFVGIVGSVVAIQKAATLATTIWTAATKAAQIASFNFSVAFKVLNMVIKANPILFIVGLIAALVAGLIYAYHHSETFRKIVDAAFRAIADAAKFMWEKVLKPAFAAIVVAVKAVGEGAIWLWNNAIMPAFNGIKTAVAAVGDAATWLWENAIMPAFNGIKTAITAVATAATWLWNTILKPIFSFIQQAAKVLFAIVAIAVLIPLIAIVKTVGTAVDFLWNKVIKPTFKAIGDAATWMWEHAIMPAFNGVITAAKAVGTAAQWLWTSAIKPAIDFIVAGFKLLGTWATWLWKNVIIPVWNGIKTTISFAYNNVIKPIIDAFKLAIERIGNAVTFLWKTYVIPAFNGIKSVIQTTWNTFINPIFTSIKKAIGLVGDAFTSAKTTIGKAWEGIKEAAKVPVRFVIDTVINKGIIDTFNSIAKSVGLTLRLGHVALPKGFARGGVTPGPDHGRDTMLIAARGRESVMVPQFTDWVGGERGVSALNRMAERGALQHFQNGGVVQPVSGAHITQGYSSKHPGVDFAAPIGTAIRNALGGRVSVQRSLTTSYGKHMWVDHGGRLETLYAHMSQFVANLGDHVNAGAVLGRVGSTGNSTGPHLHFGVQKNDGWLNPLDFLGGKTGAGEGGFAGFIEDAWKKIGSVGDWAKDKAQAAYDFVKNAPGLLRKFLGDKVGGFLGNMPGGGFFKDVAGGLPTFLIDKISDFGATLAKKISFSGGTTGGKSSKAAQSIAMGMLGQFGWNQSQWAPLRELWTGESNWRWNAENASSGAYGIPQSLPGSKMASAGSDWRTNPTTQIRWGLGYIKDRYGSPQSAYSSWLDRSPHWYAGGGVLTEPIAGLGLRTGRKYGFAERGVEHIGPGAGTGGGIHVHLHADNYVGNTNDLLRALEQSARAGRLRSILTQAGAVTKR